MLDWARVTQDNQRGRITTSLGKDAVYLESFAATERMSEPFSIVCEVLAPDSVDFGPELGTAVSLAVEGDEMVGRHFHGVLTEASETGSFEGATRYTIVLRPWFYLMQLGRNSRIFQDKTAQDIIKLVFAAAGVSTNAYTIAVKERGLIPREYCVQYGESDFNFVSRLMEEEGIYYYFVHSEGAHVMVLCDGPTCHLPFLAGPVMVNANIDRLAGEPGLWSWASHVKPALTQAMLRDVHFKAPAETNEVKPASTEGNTSLVAETYDYPGGFSYLTDDGATKGDGFALLRLQAGRAERLRYTAEGDAFGIPLGWFLTAQPVDGDETEILVTATMHRLTGQSYQSTSADRVRVFVAVEGVPAGTVWRAPQRAEKPVAKGPQTATVVGGASPDDVINVDSFGRVQVWFPWDRLDKKDKSSSCWVRVSQAWADKGFGHILIPRVGEEVIVDFLDGDMDRPIVTGRVYNAVKTVPYGLPGNKTRSTWKSQTVGKSGDYPDTVKPPGPTDVGFNEIRFEDAGPNEELYMYGHRNFKSWYRFDEDRTTGHNTTIDVGYDRVTTVKHDETKTVTDGDETHTVKTGKRTTEIQKDESLTIKAGNLLTTVDLGNETHKVSTGTRDTTIKGNETLTVTDGDQKIEVQSGKIDVSSPKKITLTCGGSTITMEPTKITIASVEIDIQASGPCKINGLVVTVKGGPMVQIN